METKRYVQLDIKATEGESGERIIEGYGAVFGNVDAWNDVILNGAFADSVKNIPNPVMLYQHDQSQVIGKWAEIVEDEKGLRVKGVLAPTARAEEVYQLVKGGFINGLSIGYRTDEADYDEKGIRLIKSASVLEVSVVTFPANDLAQIDAVKASAMTIREFEKFLRDAGLSKSVAQSLLSGGYDAVIQRDVEAKADNKSEELKFIQDLNNIL